MDALAKLPRDAQVVLGCSLLYIVVSFLDWQQWHVFGLIVQQSEWVGIGILAGILGFALFPWELSRALDAQFAVPGVSKPLTSLVLAVSLALATVLTFATHTDGQHWPAYIGLLLALVIAAAAWSRARREGVQLPAFGA